MKWFLLIVTALVLVLAFSGAVNGNDRTGNQSDDRRIDFYRDDFRPIDLRQLSPGRFDYYQDDFRPFDYDRDDFRPFDYYEDDLRLWFNDYCLIQGRAGVTA